MKKESIYLDTKTDTYYLVDHTKYPIRQNVKILYLKAVNINGIDFKGPYFLQFTETYFKQLITNKIFTLYDTSRKKSK